MSAGGGDDDDGRGRGGRGVAMRGGDSPMGHAVVSGTAAAPGFWERGKNVTILRLEDEARELRERLEAAERREQEQHAYLEAERERVRRDALSENAADRRRLDAVKVRALSRSLAKFAERHLRLGLAAFRLYARRRARRRSLVHVAEPKWLVRRTRAAWEGYVQGLTWRRRVLTAAGRVEAVVRRRRTAAAFRAWAAEARHAAASVRKAAGNTSTSTSTHLVHWSIHFVSHVHHFHMQRAIQMQTSHHARSSGARRVHPPSQ